MRDEYATPDDCEVEKAIFRVEAGDRLRTRSLWEAGEGKLDGLTTTRIESAA